MEGLRKGASDISFCLQRLTHPAVFAEVQNVVLRKDKASFAAICKKAEIPSKHIPILTRLVLSVEPTTWPP